MKVLFVNLVYGTGSTGKIIADIMNLLKSSAASENTKKRANAASRHYFKADTLFLRSTCSGEENQSKMVLVLLQS